MEKFLPFIIFAVAVFLNVFAQLNSKKKNKVKDEVTRITDDLLALGFKREKLRQITNNNTVFKRTSVTSFVKTEDKFIPKRITSDYIEHNKKRKHRQHKPVSVESVTKSKSDKTATKQEKSELILLAKGRKKDFFKQTTDKYTPLAAAFIFKEVLDLPTSLR